MNTRLFELKKAFTLIELLTTISIIGLLASLVIATVGNAQTKARNSVARNTVVEVAHAVEAFRIDPINEAEGVINTVDFVQGSHVGDGASSSNPSLHATNMPAIFTATQFIKLKDYDPTGNGGLGTFLPPISSYGAKVSKSPGKGYAFTYETDHATCGTVSGCHETSTIGYGGYPRDYGFFGIGIHGGGEPADYVFYVLNGEIGECVIVDGSGKIGGSSTGTIGGYRECGSKATYGSSDPILKKSPASFYGFDFVQYLGY